MSSALEPREPKRKGRVMKKALVFIGCSATGITLAALCLAFPSESEKTLRRKAAEGDGSASNVLYVKGLYEEARRARKQLRVNQMYV